MRFAFVLLVGLCLPMVAQAQAAPATPIAPSSSGPEAGGPADPVPESPAPAPGDTPASPVPSDTDAQAPAANAAEDSTAKPAPLGPAKAASPAESGPRADESGPRADEPEPTATTAPAPATEPPAVNLTVDNDTTNATAPAAPLPPTEHPLLAIDDELFLGFLAIGGWGVARWNWFKSGFKFKKEHGFSARSSTGGSDKTGHFFDGYAVGDLLAWRLREMGYDRTGAALWGATGSMILMTWIEVGDATSRYGWSFEDLLADFLGAAVSAVLGIYPILDDLLDFRVQYWPSEGYLSGENDDLVADYSGMKHLVAFKLGGIPYLKDTPLRFLEAQLGYYSRGFRSFDKTAPEDARRVLYFGIGVTATELLKPILPKIPGVRAWSPGILTLFEYYQPPFLAVEAATKEW